MERMKALLKAGPFFIMAIDTGLLHVIFVCALYRESNQA